MFEASLKLPILVALLLQDFLLLDLLDSQKK